jgi:hypothetical protein
MFEKKDVDRITALAVLARTGAIDPEEKGEMRRILAGYSPKVWDLAWDDVLHVAFVFLGISELSQPPVPADAS